MSETPGGRAPTDIIDRPITRSLPCGTCGYELVGLELRRECPECGRSVWSTVLDAIDPTLEIVPRMRNPRRVGQGLVGVMVCVVGAILLLLVRCTGLFIDEIGDSQMLAWTPGWLLYGAIGLLALSIWWVWILAPPRAARHGRVWRDIWLVVAGLVSAALLVLAAVFVIDGIHAMGEPSARFDEQWVVRLAMVGVILLTLVPFSRVLYVIGERSYEYRRARGGRQRIGELAITALAIGLGEVARTVGRRQGLEAMSTLGTVLVIVGSVMLVVGLGYLLVNALWIRRSLRNPVPNFRELLREDIGVLPFIDDPHTPPARRTDEMTTDG